MLAAKHTRRTTARRSTSAGTRSGTVRPGGRLQHRRPGPHRHRALLQRLPDGVQADLRPAAEPGRLAAGSHRHRRQPDHQPLVPGPAGGDGGPRPDARRRGRARAVDRAGAGDGLHADLQPQPRRRPNFPSCTGPAPARRCSTGPRRACTRPGSTFKMVTATAALKSRQVHADVAVDPGTVVQSRCRTAVQRRRRDRSAPTDLTDALTYSSTRCSPRSGRARPASSSVDAMRRVRLLPAAADRPARATRWWPAASTGTAGRSAESAPDRRRPRRDRPGQLLATPLQMAMVAGGDRQRRRRMQPSLVTGDRLAGGRRARQQAAGDRAGDGDRDSTAS